MIRKNIQKRLGDIILLVIILLLFGGTIMSAKAEGLTKKEKHPRLFFKSNELSELALLRQTTHKNEWKSLLVICENLKAKDAILKPKSKLVFAFPEKLAAVALVQLLDPSQAYQKTFEKHFWAIMNWKEWDEWIDGKGKGPGGDLGIAQALIALSACYDWQYQNFTSEEREVINNKLIRIAHHFYKDYNRFHTESFAIMNCNHGTNVYAALSAVLYGADGISYDYKKEWTDCLTHKYETLTKQMNSNMSDGFSDEGATYFMFQLKTYVQWFELRRNALEKGYGKPYEDLDWFKNASTYCMYSILPGGSDNFGGLARYADANPKFWGNPYSVFPALAKNLKDPIAQWLSSDLDLKEVELWRADKKTAKDQNQKSNYDVWRYIWKNASVPSVDLKTLPNSHFFEDAGMFVWRSSWENNASYFTIKSGQHYQGHGQPDDGQFMLHRAGVPYIIDMGYSHPKFTNEHNVLLVNGKGQVGDGDVWSKFGEYPGNKAIWGKTNVLVNTGNQQRSDYFNLMSDPSNMYPLKELKYWHREVLGINGMFLLRDDMEANEDVDFELLLHSYASRKGKKDAYLESKDRDVNPFKTIKSKEWFIDPRKGKAPLLFVKDLSESDWNETVDEAWFYDNYLRKKNGLGHVQLGNVLNRKQKSSKASSLIFFGFEDQLKGKKVESLKNGEGLSIYNKGKLEAEVSWSSDVKSSQLSFDGEMAGITWEMKQVKSWFGREVSRITDAKKTLFEANKKVSIHANAETKRMLLHVNAAESTELKIRVDNEPKSVGVNGEMLKFTFAKHMVSVVVPKGTSQKIELHL